MSRILAAALVGLAACSGQPSTACSSDSACAADQVCNAGRCVRRRVLGAAGTWDLELLPPEESAWSATEAPGVAFTGAPATVKLEARQTVTGSITGLPPAASSNLLAAAGVVLSTPSRIAGHGPRLFQTQGISPLAQDIQTIEFSVGVPDSAMGTNVDLRVVPSALLGRLLPPWVAHIQPLDRSMVVRVPDQINLPTITLQNADGSPASGDPAATRYVARARVDGRLVSNVARMDPQQPGRFLSLVVPKELSSENIALEITPENALAAFTWLRVAPPPTVNTTYRLPGQLLQQGYDVPVTGDGKPQTAVSLRFRARLTDTTAGEAFFDVATHTDESGKAHVRLRPGAPGETQDYVVAAVTPAGSPFASRCLADPPFRSVFTGGDTRVAPTIELSPRAELVGRVLDPEGAPLRNVAVTATRRLDDPALASCPLPLVAPPTGTLTSHTGEFRMFLDPGLYRLEYEPPANASSPYTVEERVAITGAVRRETTLPAGTPAEGVVQSPAGRPVPRCEVRAYAPNDVSGQPRARGLTDQDGRFRLVLPRP